MSLPATVALTGATGFIGGAIARRLLEAGVQVRALRRSRVPEGAATGGRLTWVVGSLEDRASLERLVAGSEAVVHCAGAVRGAGRAGFERVNVAGVERLAACAVAGGVRRFLLISSLAAREPQLSPYAASKRAGELALARTAGAMQWAALRPPAVYGPGDRELMGLFRWIGRGLLPVLNGEDARFSLLYVDDLAAAVLAWLQAAQGTGTTLELHDGRPGGYAWADVGAVAQALLARPVRRVRIPVAVLQIAAAVNRALALTGYAPMLTPGKVRELRHADWVCDNARMHAATGWLPEVGLEEALRRTFGWGAGSDRNP